MSSKRKADPAGAPASKKAAGDRGLVNSKRVRKLKDLDIGSGPVIYWCGPGGGASARCECVAGCMAADPAPPSRARRMSRDQRMQDNWALLHALQQAQSTKAPVAVAFNLVGLRRCCRR
jgi:deoxyribodipyrimidine photo-lyase